MKYKIIDNSRETLPLKITSIKLLVMEILFIYSLQVMLVKDSQVTKRLYDSILYYQANEL